MVGDVCGLSFIVCHLFHFMNGRLGQGFLLFVLVSLFMSLLVWQHDTSFALNIWAVIAKLFSEEYM